MTVYHVDADGTVYMGDRLKLYLDGHGVMLHKDFTYYGEWKDSRWNGEGIIQWTNGTIYIGSFVDNNATGRGCMWFTNGNVYSGGIKDGEFHGEGHYYWKDLSLAADGVFVNGIMVETNSIQKVSPTMGRSLQIPREAFETHP